MKISSTMNDDKFLVIKNNEGGDGCPDVDDGDSDTTTSLWSSSFDFVESTYAYESFDDVELHEILERFEISGSSSDGDDDVSSNVVEPSMAASDVNVGNDVVSDIAEDDEDMKRKMLAEHGGGGDASAPVAAFKSFRAQLVRVCFTSIP